MDSGATEDETRLILTRLAGQSARAKEMPISDVYLILFWIKVFFCCALWSRIVVVCRHPSVITCDCMV